MIGGMIHIDPPIQQALMLIKRDRRIVVIESDGLHRIIGTSVTQPADIMLAKDHEERNIFFSLIKCTRASWVYREIVPPMTTAYGDGSFNKSQR